MGIKAAINGTPLEKTVKAFLDLCNEAHKFQKRKTTKKCISSIKDKELYEVIHRVEKTVQMEMGMINIYKTNIVVIIPIDQWHGMAQEDKMYCLLISHKFSPKCEGKCDHFYGISETSDIPKNYIKTYGENIISHIELFFEMKGY